MTRGRPRKNPQDPQTQAEWQDAVNAAEFCVALDSCKQYGLLDGVPNINVERAIELLRRGAGRGFRPLPLEELLKLYIDDAAMPRA